MDGALTRRLPAALLLALGLAFALTVLTAEGGSAVSGRLGGDLPEFVGAGALVDADVDAATLYDPAAQVAAQAPYLPPGEGGGILFGYPAFVAAPYALPVALGLPYPTVYALVTAVMVGLLVAAVTVVRRLVPLVGRLPFTAVVAYAVTFIPLFVGLTGGQTTAVAGLLLVLLWWCWAHDEDVGAGLAAALLLYKPQYGAVAFLALALRGRPRALVAGTVGAAALWVAGALTTGADWVGPWLRLVRDFTALDGGANADNEVSLPGVAHALLGTGTTAATVVGAAAALAVGTATVLALRRRPPLGPGLALVVTATLLCSPHTLFYDLGLVLPAVAALLPGLDRPAGRRLLVAVWLLGATHVLAGTLGADPSIGVLLVVWGVAAHQARRGPALASGHGDDLHPHHRGRATGTVRVA